MENLEYVGFRPRVGASLIDTLLLMAIIFPLSYIFYGPEYWLSTALIYGPTDLLINWILPAVAVIAFCNAKQATPGNMAISAKIVDEQPGRAPNIIRYFRYYISCIPLFVGLIWLAFDKKHQCWHDKIASTTVIRPQDHGPEPVSLPDHR